MTCDQFDHLTDDDNGRDISDYSDAEIMGMTRHMLECPRCHTKAMLEAVAFEQTRSRAEIHANNAKSDAIFNRIVPRLASDPEL